MFAPNISTDQMADSMHAERQAHAALLHRAKADRSRDTVTVDREVQRRITARRLTAAMASAILTLAIAAAVAANQPDAAPAAGPSSAGGLTVIR